MITKHKKKQIKEIGLSYGERMKFIAALAQYKKKDPKWREHLMDTNDTLSSNNNKQGGESDNVNLVEAADNMDDNEDLYYQGNMGQSGGGGHNNMNINMGGGGGNWGGGGRGGGGLPLPPQPQMNEGNVTGGGDYLD